MKKILLTGISLLVFANVVSAAVHDYSWTKTVKPGVYKCPYKTTDKYTGKTFTTCTMDIRGKSFSYSAACPDNSDILKNLIKSGKCTFKPVKVTTYSCQYSKGSCIVEVSSVSGESVYCMGDISTAQAKADYKAGKCYKN